MKNVIRKTFGGLSLQYYIRQLFFGSLFLALIFSTRALGDGNIDWGVASIFIISTFLYPYSRFVYESIIGYIVGDNVFYINAILMMMVKLFTMAVCWSFSIFIAPVGLAYLYYYHSKATVQ